MSSSPHNSRASLLSGLRTGGVRSVSSNLPHSAASARFSPSVYSEEDDQSLYLNSRSIPLTAAVDGSTNRFAQQQAQLGLNPNSVPFSPAPFTATQPILPQHSQAFQMQLLQLEMIRIQSQALQAQQLQAQLIAQAHRQQQQSQAQAQAQARERRLSLNPPATAGAHITAFDLRSATLSAQMRRANQTEQLRAQLSLAASPLVEEQVPMTAALGGKFGARMPSGGNSLSRYIVEESEEFPDQVSVNPVSKAALSGGASLNNSFSRSDQVANWRRNGNGNSSLSGSFRAVSSPAVKITPPPGDNQRSSPPLGLPMSASRSRPLPLKIASAASQPLAAVAIGTTDDDDTEATCSSVGSASVRSALSGTSSPITPPSSAAHNESQLSPREEATKKLYEGLGIGRPVPPITNTTEQSHPNQQQPQAISNHRMVSQPTRQPRGPPSGADELGPKNFATRIRRQAIGGLGALMGARERRESYVEAY